MSDLSGEYFYLNGQIKPAIEFDASILSGDDIVYEVMRMVNGVPLFFEDHFARMRLSCGLLKYNCGLSENELKQVINQLNQKNNISHSNIKIVLHPQENRKTLLIQHMKSYYPPMKDYEEGVNTKIYFSERNRPNAKVYNVLWRNALEEFISKNKLAEAILVNKLNQITEASRSNLFLIKNDVLFSTPEVYVLPGVTRKKTIQLAKNLGIEYREEIFRLKQLSDFDALLLSSTSKKLLPIKSVDNYIFNPQNKTAQMLIKAFFKLEEDYLISQC